MPHLLALDERLFLTIDEVTGKKKDGVGSLEHRQRLMFLSLWLRRPVA